MWARKQGFLMYAKRIADAQPRLQNMLYKAADSEIGEVKP